MAEEILIIKAKALNFTSDTGEIIQGVSLTWTDGSTHEEEDFRTGEITERGLRTFDEWLPLPVWKNIKAVPGFYQPVEEHRSYKDPKSGKFKRVIKVVDVIFRRAVDVRGVEGVAVVNASANGNVKVGV